LRATLIYNICGINGKDNNGSYCWSIDSILEQKKNVNFELDIVVSSCLSKDRDLYELDQVYGNLIKIIEHKDKVPVNITFNNSVRLSRESDVYIYVDSGVTFTNPHQLQKLFDMHFAEDCAISVLKTDTDSGFVGWFGSEDIAKHQHYHIPLGKTCNLHCAMFDKSILEAYGRILPDVFAGQCTESTFSFIAASVCKNFVILKEEVCEHVISLDGASAGFLHEVHQQKVPPFNHTVKFSKKTIMERLEEHSENAIKYGLGFEENKNVFRHNPNAYYQGFPRNPKGLQEVINKVFYLQKDEFDYVKLTTS